MRLVLFFLFFAVILLSCNSKTGETEVLVKTENYILLKSELDRFRPKFNSKEDSIDWTNSFIQSWIRDKSFIESANKKLISQDLDFEDQIRDYKFSLIRHRYEEWLISRYLDTVVTSESIESYYQENKSSFLLLDYMIQPHFVTLDIETDKKLKRKAKKLFKSKKEKDWLELDKLCYQLDADYELFDSTWYKWNDFSTSFNLEIDKISSWLKYNNIIDYEDSTTYYLIKVEDYKLKDQVSPLEFEREKIKKIILLRRKLKLLKEKKEEIYQDYLENVHQNE